MSGNNETRIRTITVRHSLLPTSQARTTLGNALRHAVPEGSDTRFPRSVPRSNIGLGACCRPGCMWITRHLSRRDASRIRYLLVQARYCSHFRLLHITVFIADSSSFTIPTSWHSPGLWLPGGSLNLRLTPRALRRFVTLSGSLLIQTRSFIW